MIKVEKDTQSFEGISLNDYRKQNDYLSESLKKVENSKNSVDDEIIEKPIIPKKVENSFGYRFFMLFVSDLLRSTNGSAIFLC